MNERVQTFSGAATSELEGVWLSGLETSLAAAFLANSAGFFLVSSVVKSSNRKDREDKDREEKIVEFAKITSGIYGVHGFSFVLAFS
jgi:hypothetical protein